MARKLLRVKLQQFLFDVTFFCHRGHVHTLFNGRHKRQSRDVAESEHPAGEAMALLAVQEGALSSGYCKRDVE